MYKDKVQQVDINMSINKIYQVRKVKQIFTGYISLDFGIAYIAEYAACNVLQTACSKSSPGTFQIVAGFWTVLWKGYFILKKWVQLFVLIMINPILARV